MRAAASPVVRSWIEETGSLTARLRATCGAGFGVTVLRQDWRRPFAGEAHILNLGRGQGALVREVVLHCAGRPLIVARSVIPRATLRRTHRRLAHLGNRPLGEWLFSHPGLVRLGLDVTVVGADRWGPALAKEFGLGGGVWGRRSVYEIAEGRVLVCEFFLPAIATLVSP
jgi:chorismate--pyruvate lyase